MRPFRSMLLAAALAAEEQSTSRLRDRGGLHAAIEIDTVDDRLLVFTRWDLGTDPLHVLDALTAAGFAGS